MTEVEPRPFLTAEWRYLAMFNFKIEPALLEPYVPARTALDFYKGSTYVSLVGFLFRDTRVLGLPVPLHRSFEEVNLRIYVKRVVGGELRRGVTFIRELVPRWAIATTARMVYNEPYSALPMRHRVDEAQSGDLMVEYSWMNAGRWNRLRVSAGGPLVPLASGSEEEFITEHYWGYTRQRDGSTIEYAVQHPSWRSWHVTSFGLDVDFHALYGSPFAAVLANAPASVLLAEGSSVAVHRPVRVTQ